MCTLAGGRCYGRYKHYICNYALKDLPKAWSSGCLVGNKFSLNVDAQAVMCQIKRLLEQSRSSIDLISQPRL